MKLLALAKIEKTLFGDIQITGSKSESNRLLILQQFYPNLSIENLSNSDDSQLMQKALASSEKQISISHAGTAMRFLTAYFALKENSEIILTGSHRMKNRPIKILVDALRDLGAKIEYVEIINKNNLESVNIIEEGTFVAVAVYYGKTRLIDNIVLG